MFVVCTGCHGTGYLRGTRYEEGDICCDYGGTYYCDDCEEPFEPETGNISEPHFCPDCEKRRSEEEKT